MTLKILQLVYIIYLADGILNSEEMVIVNVNSEKGTAKACSREGEVYTIKKGGGIYYTISTEEIGVENVVVTKEQKALFRLREVFLVGGEQTNRIKKNK